MRIPFQLKSLSLAIAAFSVASVASAAGLDRSGQDITAFLQDGLYAEASYTYLDADVGGYDSKNNIPTSNSYVRGSEIDDMAESYDFFRYGVKADLNDTFSVGVLYDEPFGAAAKYEGDNNFVSRSGTDAAVNRLTGGTFTNQSTIGTAIASQTAIANDETRSAADRAAAAKQASELATALGAARAENSNAGEGTNVEVRTESITGILGAKFGANKEFQIYGGPVAQRVQADVKLRGIAYGPATGYSAYISPDQDYGWLVGASYSKPEIALKAALTYRSEIDHDVNVAEVYPLLEELALIQGAPSTVAAAAANRSGKFRITTPKSVNLDFQTGVTPTMLATAKVRWVPWGDFSIVPPLYNEVSKLNPQYKENGLPLVSYDKDQWMVELGLAKRLTDALAISGNIGWDRGAGNPVTSLGPIKGYYSAGLGAKYNLTENWAISAGGKYLWFGDAEGKLPTDKIVGEFEDNDGYALGVKVSYQAK
ncbi:MULTISPECIES: outer membrane protein transport protein [Psychrobacter]|uniref:outer membrane protein transport protein n=1 Tax=Psychrobacter TaxID=497 RepID=UPI00146C85B9|nr:MULTISPECIES: outer membrane protein transport protein [Psychrobacter]